MDVGFEAKDSISKEAQNPKCGKPHSTFLEGRALLYNQNRGNGIILVILTTRLTHHESSGGRMHCYFAKMVCSAYSPAGSLVLCRPQGFHPRQLGTWVTGAGLLALPRGQSKGAQLEYLLLV